MDRSIIKENLNSISPEIGKIQVIQVGDKTRWHCPRIIIANQGWGRYENGLFVLDYSNAQQTVNSSTDDPIDNDAHLRENKR